jgi:hypothetical protein
MNMRRHHQQKERRRRTKCSVAGRGGVEERAGGMWCCKKPSHALENPTDTSTTKGKTRRKQRRLHKQASWNKTCLCGEKATSLRPRPSRVWLDDTSKGCACCLRWRTLCASEQTCVATQQLLCFRMQDLWVGCVWSSDLSRRRLGCTWVGGGHHHRSSSGHHQNFCREHGWWWGVRRSSRPIREMKSKGNKNTNAIALVQGYHLVLSFFWLREPG